MHTWVEDVEKMANVVKVTNLSICEMSKMGRLVLRDWTYIKNVYHCLGDNLSCPLMYCDDVDDNKEWKLKLESRLHG